MKELMSTVFVLSFVVICGVVSVICAHDWLRERRFVERCTISLMAQMERLDGRPFDIGRAREICEARP